MIRDVSYNDIEQIAKLHIISFEGHFLPKLGIKLLGRYYEEFLNDQNIFLVYVDQLTNKINGFILGTPDSSIGVNRFIKRNKVKLSIRVLYLCLKLDKETWCRVHKFIRSLLHMRKIDNYEDKENKFDSSYLTLLSICVSPEYKGKGLAMQLVEDFEKRLINNGYNGYTLTVHKTNSRANKFYRKLFMSIYKETKNEYGYIKRLI